MKKLIFLDNDDERRAGTDLKNNVIPILKEFGGIPATNLKEIEVIHDLWRKDIDNICHILFNPDNAILTWSVYTSAPLHNSLVQFLRFMRIAGQHRKIKNCTYIDVSGMLADKLSSAIQSGEVKHLFDILYAIEVNNIITHNDTFEFIKLKLEIKSDSGLSEDKIDLKKLLEF